MNLSELCLRRPVLAIVMSMLIVTIGLVSLTRVALRELPEVDTAEVTVSVEYTGAAPEVVDAEITTVIENAVSGISGIRTISSESERGSNRTVIEFDISRDIDDAANDVRAEISRVTPDLPEEAEEPEVEKNDNESEPVIRLTMASDTLSPLELTDYADRYVVDQLGALDGVASVEINGERAYAMRIWLDGRKLAARDISVDDVTAAIEGSNVELPAGEIDTERRTLQVRTDTRFTNADDFTRMVVAERGGYQVLLGDIASVEVGAEDDDSLLRANGEAAIGLGILRQSSANTVQISEAVQQELGPITDALPEGTRITVSSDDAIFIRGSIAEVVKTLGIAVLLVVAVIFLFLASPRATLVPAVTIPIALIGACAGIALAGFSINILTLFALILAIGLVVDDAIVVLENIQRRIETGESPLLASARGARQVTFAVLATSVTLISVFIPLSFLQGEVGRLFREFGFIMALAVAVSTFVALSLCPVIAANILPSKPRRGRLAGAVEAALKRVNSGYRGLLTHALKWPALVLGIAAFLSASAFVIYQNLPGELTPEEDRGVFFVSIDTPQGANLSVTDEVTAQVEALLEPYREDGTITDIIALVGRYGELNSAFVVASMADWGAREMSPQDLIAELQPQFDTITAASVRANAPSALGAGGGARPLEVVVNAPDFEQADQWSRQLEAMMRENPDLTAIERDYEVNQPGLSITLDRRRAQDLGIDAATVSGALQTLIASQEVTEYTDRGRQYPVILQAAAEARDNPADIGTFALRTNDGAIVPLDGLITVADEASVSAFNRFDRLPAVTISAGLAEGYDLGAAIGFIEQLATELLEGARVGFDGEAREFLDTSSGALIVFAFAVLIVFFVLAAQFESFVLPVVIMLSVPLAIAGALLTLLLTWQSLNVYSQVGLVLLVGLMAKNGILIVEFANQLRDEGRPVREAIVEGAVVRLRPILMTVVSTILGAVPLVLSTGAGAEARLAIGLVIIGGFAFASVLTLILTPVLYDLLAPFTEPRAAVRKRLEAEISGPSEASGCR